MKRMITPYGNEAIIPDDRVEEFEAAGYTAADAPAAAKEEAPKKKPIKKK